MFKAAVQMWNKQFREGRDSIKDVKRTGWPRSARTLDNIQRVLTAVQSERSCTISELSQHLDMSESSVRTVLKKDLRMTKLCPKFIPKLLTDEPKAFWVCLCEQNLESIRQDNEFLAKVVTGDESWVSVEELPLRKDSKEWHPKGAPCPLKPLRNWSARKSMLTAFFDMSRPVLVEFVTPGQNVTSKTYCETLRVLKEQIRWKRPHLWEMTDEGYRTFLLQHNNASSHTVIPTLAFIGLSDILIVPHPPYSPDLAPCDYFLFPRLKADLHRHKFRGLQELQTAVRQALKNIPKEDYRAALECLPMRWMKCVKS